MEINIDQIREILKKELKEELKEELSIKKQGVLSELTSLDIISLLKTNKEIEKTLAYYAKSLIISEHKLILMKNSGFNFSESVNTEYVFDLPIVKSNKTQFIDLGKFSSIYIFNLHKYLKDNSLIRCDYQVFVDVLSKEINDKRIEWIDKGLRNKTVNTYSLFDFLYQLNPEIILYYDRNLEQFLLTIITKFQKDSNLHDNQNLFIYNNLYNSFSKWRKKALG